MREGDGIDEVGICSMKLRGIHASWVNNWKTRMLGLPGDENMFDDMLSHFEQITHHKCDRQSDKQTDTRTDIRTERSHTVLM